jgi:hypothetical protein
LPSPEEELKRQVVVRELDKVMIVRVSELKG